MNFLINYSLSQKVTKYIYTNEQLLFEHVINLESQIAVLRQKHKNLKRNYKQIYEDVYVDDENAYDEQPIQEQPIQQETIQQ